VRGYGEAAEEERKRWRDEQERLVEGLREAAGRRRIEHVRELNKRKREDRARKEEAKREVERERGNEEVGRKGQGRRNTKRDYDDPE
jgi:hypothetical protein